MPLPRLGRLLRPAAFGGIPTGARLERMQASPQYADGSFRNPTNTLTMASGSVLDLARTNVHRADRVRRRPATAIPLHRPAVAGPDAAPESGLRLTWTGHSTVLTEIDGARLLFDPVWGERCSPVGFAGPRRLHPVPLPLEDLGPVDVVVISHDHYDHLDMPTIRALVGTGAQFAVPLGVGAHLERWGVAPERITELDWHESTQVAGLTLTATPARHFCGRAVHRRTLWASWVASGPRHRVFHSGDTGYFPGFAEIGAAHGPFDAVMMQIGAYSDFWPDIHMTPEEGLRAHLDLGGGEPHGVLLPIHWGTFNLAPHPWEEPAERTYAAAAEAGARVALPIPGQPFEPGGELPQAPWWRTVAAPASDAASTVPKARRPASARPAPAQQQL